MGRGWRSKLTFNGGMKNGWNIEDSIKDRNGNYHDDIIYEIVNE